MLVGKPSVTSQSSVGTRTHVGAPTFASTKMLVPNISVSAHSRMASRIGLLKTQPSSFPAAISDAIFVSDLRFKTSLFADALYYNYSCAIRT